MKKILSVFMCLVAMPFCFSEKEAEPSKIEKAIDVVENTNANQEKNAQSVNVAASLAHLTEQIKKEAAQSIVTPMNPEDLEKLNRAIDPEEDIHIVSLEYEKGKLKNMKIDAFVVNNDIQLSTTYVLAFSDCSLDLTIEDYLTGLENILPPTDEPAQSYTTDFYAVECFKKGKAYHSTFKRTCKASFDKPMNSGVTRCHAPADDELQIFQKLHMDNDQFISSIQEGIKANIQAVLDDDEAGVAFVITKAKTSPDKLLKQLFETDLRVYLFNNMLSTLLKPEEPDSSKKNLEEHKFQG